MIVRKIFESYNMLYRKINTLKLFRSVLEIRFFRKRSEKQIDLYKICWNFRLQDQEINRQKSQNCANMFVWLDRLSLDCF